MKSTQLHLTRYSQNCGNAPQLREYRERYVKDFIFDYIIGGIMIKPQYPMEDIIYIDGSWRDIYIENTDLSDWNRFLDYLRINNTETTFHKDSEIIGNQGYRADAIFRMKEDSCVCLCIKCSTTKINCHFFDESEIELDLDPNDIQDIGEFNKVMNFIEDLCQYIGKPAILTPENTKSCVLIAFEQLEYERPSQKQRTPKIAA